VRGGLRSEVRLEPLLAPRSIAVLGATDRPGSYGQLILDNIERSEFAGPVWGINPKRQRIGTIECVPSVAELPEPVDAVVVAIPAPGVPTVLGEIAARGCGGAVVISAGFGEAAEGRELEGQLREVALRTGLPVCGPNGNGIVSLPAAAPMWGDALQPLQRGPVALVSQSGNVAVNAVGSRRGIGFHTIVSTGNQAVCDASDWLAGISELDGVGAVALFLESDGEGAKLADALARCAERGIGVAVLKVGASPLGAGAAAAHTGSLAGDQRFFRALIEEAGGAWAETPHDLLELVRVLAEPRARPRGDGGLAVLTCSGGDSGVAADQAAALGLKLPPLGESARLRLAELLPDAATIGNPLDYTAMLWDDTERLEGIARAVGDDPAIDQLLLLFDSPPGLAPASAESWSRTRTALATGAARSAAAPILASTLPDLLGEETVAELGRLGVPAVAGLWTAMRCAAELRVGAGDPTRLREIAAACERLTGAAEPAGAAVAPPGAGEVAGPGEEDGWLDEVAAKELLRRGGVAAPEGLPAADGEEAAAVAARLGWPLALKLAAPSIRHKSELGAVVLGIENSEGLAAACERLLALPAAGAPGARLLVERMAAPGVELLVSVRADAVVPALVLGMGGIWTEVFADAVVVPLPVSPARAERALRSLRGFPLLAGTRGRPAADLAALGRLASRAGELALAEGLELLELNPVFARPDGAEAIDALAVRRPR
jgi:acetate---CoA ligase (ADP-forming)